MASASELRSTEDAWVKHEVSDDADSSLSFYYSDDLSPLPIREVTRPGDNKADPNLETDTYGLFTTCCRGTRSAIVSNERPYLFFCTRRSGRRVLTGYYRIDWYAKHQKIKRDFALAAGYAHFVGNPVPLTEINQEVGTDFSETFRQSRLVAPADAESLRNILREQSDITDEYVDEIRRLERFNLAHGGYRYVAHQRKQSFDWSDAEAILSTGLGMDSDEDLLTKSPTGQWRCESCGEMHQSGRLLRQCPICGVANTIVPVSETP